MTRAHGMYANFVENTFCQYENAIVDLITTHKVKRVFFTGHSLGGGLANVAHLAVRGQLALGQAGLLGSGSPWTNPKLAEDQVEWLACTFAAPATIVRPPAETQLIKDLDGSSYNIVYDCDAVPRGLGMLTYLDDLLKSVVLPLTGQKTKDEVLNTLPFFLLNTAGKNGVDPVKLLKSSGTTTVMRQFTHIGTVVYKKSEDSSYIYLLGKTEISGELDQAWKWEITIPFYRAALLVSAHAYYEEFAFGAK
eukprot:scaffold32696_cov59-Phaeocystis_antarctica.AAC.2